MQPDCAGKLHEFQPAGVTEWFAAGQADTLTAKSRKLFDQSAECLLRHVGSGGGLPCFDPAVRTVEIAGAGDGERQRLGRAQPLPLENSYCFKRDHTLVLYFIMSINLPDLKPGRFRIFQNDSDCNANANK